MNFFPKLETMDSVRSNNLSLKRPWFTTIGCKDIRISKFEFVQRLNFFVRLKLPLFCGKFFRNPKKRLLNYNFERVLLHI